VSAPNLIKHEQFPSRFLRNRRDLIVYLPPGYDVQRSRCFPVLYLHDGQNLFDGATSFVPGVDWHVGHTADQWIAQGSVEPAIIVGIYNAGKQRLGEYTPTRSPRLGGGRANRYAKFLLEEVQPMVKKN
jgi:predicted alpha/beta superfamily hydrolase